MCITTWWIFFNLQIKANIHKSNGAKWGQCLKGTSGEMRSGPGGIHMTIVWALCQMDA